MPWRGDINTLCICIWFHLVLVTEEEKLSSAGGGASHMAKEVAVDVPKSSVKAQDHLENIEIEMLQTDLVQTDKN